LRESSFDENYKILRDSLKQIVGVSIRLIIESRDYPDDVSEI
jgi:hypothetical protein